MPLDTVHLDAFLPDVMPHVGTCPQIIATRHLRAAAIRFCEKTRLWRETISQTVSANDFAIDLPEYASLHVIKRVWHDGNLLAPSVFDDTYEPMMTGTPSYFSQKVSGTLHISPYTSGDVTIDVILKPRQGQSFGTHPGDAPDQDAYDRVPEFMHRDHADIIASGAIASIRLLPDQEFTNPEVAAYHAGIFAEALTRLANSDVRHQVRPPLRTKTRWF